MSEHVSAGRATIHALRNALNSIVASTLVLRETLHAPAVETFVDGIQSRAREASNLIVDLQAIIEDLEGRANVQASG